MCQPFLMYNQKVLCLHKDDVFIKFDIVKGSQARITSRWLKDPMDPGVTTVVTATIVGLGLTERWKIMMTAGAVIILFCLLYSVY